MRTNGRTEMTKLIIASYNLAKTPKKQETEFAFEIGPRREIVVFFFHFELQNFIYNLYGECIWG